MTRCYCGLLALALLASCVVAVDTTYPDNPTAPTPVPAPTMTWKAWIALATCFAVLFVLMARIITCFAAMILASTFLYLCGIISLKEMLAGLSNSGVVAIALLFVCVDPIADLPLVKKFVGKCLGGQSVSPALARFKIVMLCTLVGSFIENLPMVAVLTSLIKSHCREHGLFPSQFLMPMDFATLISNYSIIGSSTNLIVSGLMHSAGLGSMSFFEPLKVNGPFFPVLTLYLVYAPDVLLPLDKGGPTRVSTGTKLAVALRVDRGSRVIGSAFSNLNSFLPEQQPNIRVVELERNGNALAEPSSETMVEEGDVLTVAGSPRLLRASAHMLGLSWIQPDALNCPEESPGGAGHINTSASAAGPINNSIPPAAPIDTAVPAAAGPVSPSAAPAAPVSPSGPPAVTAGAPAAPAEPNSASAPAAPVSPSGPPAVTAGAPAAPVSTSGPSAGPAGPDSSTDAAANRQGTPKIPANTSAPCALAVPSTQILQSRAPQSPTAGTRSSLAVVAGHARVLHESHTTPFLAALSPACRFLGQPAVSGEFQKHYNLSIVEARRPGEDKILGDALSQYRFQEGDVLLVLAPADFKSANSGEEDFLSINSCDEQEVQPLAVASDSWLFPLWFPYGETITDGERQGKVIPIPLWYPYLVIPVFLVMIAGAIAEVADLVVCALIASIALVALGVVSPASALKSIDMELIVTVAFSFGLGTGMDSSGFSKFLGYQVEVSQLTGLPLLYAIAFISAVMGNMITDKAAVQVVVPLVIAMYKAQGLNPLGAIMCCLCVSSQALCTPYGFSTNLMIMGPGGYVPLDFLRFGLPLNLLGVALIPLICYGGYYL